MSYEVIDLRSDTLTRPTNEMLRAMSAAELGDDCFGEDRSVKMLEEYCADIFGKESALLMPSGTMSNQIAIRAMVDRGQEVICDVSYHINFFESSQTSDLGGVTLNAVDSQDGILTLEVIKDAIESRARWTKNYATPKLIWQENSINGRGGKTIPILSLIEVAAWAKSNGLSIYTDGARLFNASVATGISPQVYGRTTDALSICFAKGLGAPMGSILIGSNEFISSARHFRKWYGGALHQSGIIAAAAMFALKNNLPRLAEDHINAKYFSRVLRNTGLVEVVEPDTNIVIFNISKIAIDPKGFVERISKVGVKILAWRGDEIRAVFSLNINLIQARRAATLVAAEIEKIGLRTREIELEAVN